MPAPDVGPTSREQRLIAMLHAITRSLSGGLPLPEAILEITEAARALFDFERIAVLRLEPPDRLHVHAAAHGVSWTEGRVLRRSDCSLALWPDPIAAALTRDTRRELDRAFPMDREIIERGTRSILRVPLIGRAGPIGMLAFSSSRVDAFTGDDLDTASSIAGLVALALEHERLLTNEVRRQARMAALELLLPQLAAAREVEDIARLLVSLSPGVLKHDALTIGVIHPDMPMVRQYSLIDGERELIADVPLPAIEQQIKAMAPLEYMRVEDIEILDRQTRRGIIHMAQGERRTAMEVNIPEPVWPLLHGESIRSQVRVLIQRGGGWLGGIIFSSRQPNAFDEEDAAIARRLAVRVSLSLAHERLSEASRRASESSERARALEARVGVLQRELENARGAHPVVGVSKGWRDVLSHATRVAGTETTVLLTGESGTGKEVVARFIHHASPRSVGPLVALNCAALPEQLLEAELFGHEKGAFTGAQATRIGRIEQASGGVLFLDEVGEMSPSVQAKFLRVLQEREYQRIGGTRTMKADVRVIAATNRDLRAAMTRGEFREDLYYRLHVFEIHLPPLRQRPQDVLALAEHFLAELGGALGHSAAGMTTEARDSLMEYHWPGNVRELRNVIERALILCDGGLIHPEHLAFTTVLAAAGHHPSENGAGAVATATSFDPLGADGPFPEAGVDLEAVERSLVERAMKRVNGNKARAARLLGLTRAQLYSRLEKYGL